MHEVGDGEFWVLSRFDDVFAAARDTATYSSANGLTTAPDDMASFGDEARPIVMMDPPEHTAMRRLVSRPMTPRQVAPVEDQVRAFVADKLDAVADAGDIDIVQSLFKPLPSYLVAHYLGVPPQYRVLFDRWTERIVQATAESTAAYGQNQSAFLELFEYATGLIERRKTEPGDDLVTGLVAQGEDVASVARLQCRVALEELLRRFPDYSVDEDTARFASGWSTRRYEYLPFSTN